MGVFVKGDVVLTATNPDMIKTLLSLGFEESAKAPQENLTELKAEADALGLSYSPRVAAAKLQALIDEAKNERETESAD